MFRQLRFGQQVIWRSLAVTAVYFLGGRAGLWVAATGGGYAAPVWPPTGIALAAVLIWGVELVPAVWVGAFAVNFLIRRTPDFSNFTISAAIASGNALEAVTLSYILKNIFDFSPSFPRVADVTGFVTASIVAPIVSATLGVLTLFLFSGVLPLARAPEAWVTWWIGDVLGALVVAPVFLVWADRKSAPVARSSFASCGLYPLILGFMCVLAFAGFVPPEMRALFVSFAVYSGLIWCALALPVRAYFTVMACASALEIFAVLQGYGLLGSTSNIVHRLSLLQFFLGCTTISLMTLSAAARERFHALGTAHDREIALIESEKMSTLGRMVGAIAHEINGPLFIISGKSLLMKERAETEPLDPEKIAREAGSIHGMASRIEKIVKSIKFFSRFSETDPFEPYALKAIVDDALELCSEQFRRKGVELIIDEIPDGLDLECRPVEIGQVLLNLLNNACSAVADQAEKWVRLSAAFEGESLSISVIDSGGGIEPDMRNRIFQPFFTTKKPGEGTGIGLSVSKTIIESHGGTVSIDPESQNTRFVVSLPRHRAG